jgi:rubrerythrin
VNQPTQDAEPSPSPEKLLAIGMYGETVAAYRYLVLSEKALTEEHRKAFADMADEEQGHKERLGKLAAEMFPDSDFVLSQADKDRVVTGPRLLEIRDQADYAETMRLLLETERKTARFYARHSKVVTDGALRSLFHELAEEEGDEHYRRLKALAKDAGVRE